MAAHFFNQSCFVTQSGKMAVFFSIARQLTMDSTLECSQSTDLEDCMMLVCLYLCIAGENIPDPISWSMNFRC